MHLYAAALNRPEPADSMEGLLPESGGVAQVFEELRAGLGSYDRHIAHLRFEVGMKHEGIARAVGMTRADVARRLVKIRKRAVILWNQRALGPPRRANP